MQRQLAQRLFSRLSVAFCNGCLQPSSGLLRASAVQAPLAATKLCATLNEIRLDDGNIRGTLP